MVSTHLKKYARQNGWLSSPIFGMKIPTNIWVATTQKILQHPISSDFLISTNRWFQGGLNHWFPLTLRPAISNPEKGVKNGVRLTDCPRSSELELWSFEICLGRRRRRENDCCRGWFPLVFFGVGANPTQETTQLMNVRNPTFGREKKTEVWNS